MMDSLKDKDVVRKDLMKTILTELIDAEELF